MKKIFLIAIFCFLTVKIVAQTKVLKDNGTWLTMVTKFTISNNWYVTNVLQQRRVYFLKHTQATLLAPSINYKINKNLSIGMGYMWYRYHTYGISHASITRDENRFYQHLNFSNKIGNIKISNRLRFEQRYLELIDKSLTPNVISGKKYMQRIRYRLQATFNLFKITKKEHLLGRLSNEIRIRLGAGFNNPDFDQNNFAALVGYRPNKNSTIWMGYGRYYFKKKSNLFVSNNIMHVTLNYNFDFR